MVESTQNSFFLLVHLGVCQNLTQSPSKQLKLKQKRLLLKNVLKKAKSNFQDDPEATLLTAIGEIERSGLANAGTGCFLTEKGTAELEASFAGVDQDRKALSRVNCEKMNRALSGSITSIGLENGLGVMPTELAYKVYKKQVEYFREQDGTRPPLILSGKGALGQHTRAVESGFDFVTQKKLSRLEKKRRKAGDGAPGDTIGGFIVTGVGQGYACTSSGGPWLKQCGRVGSSAIRGAGFDLGKVTETELAFCLASGHGENIIEGQTCSRALRKLRKKGYAPEADKLMGDEGDRWWDLGLITCLFDQQTGNGAVSLVQTADGFLYGFISSQMEKPALQFSQRAEKSRFVQSGFNFTLS